MSQAQHPWKGSDTIHTSEPLANPDYTVLRDHRLIAQLWAGEPGHLRSGGRRGHEPVCEVPFANVITFDAGLTTLLVELVGASQDLQTFLLKLEIEGFRLMEGSLAPNSAFRRF